jgi:DNA polymerase-1
MSQVTLKPWAYDTETGRFSKGNMAPEMVCMTYADYVDKPGILHRTDPAAHDLLEEKLKSALIIGQNVAYDMGVIANTYPDLIPLIFKAYAEDRVTDTMIRQHLLDIAVGCFRGYMDGNDVWVPLKYSLDALARRHLGVYLKKDGWRLRYGEFATVPISQWVDKATELQQEAVVLLQREGPKPADQRYYDGHDPKDLLAIVADAPEQALKYPLDDATTTLDVYAAQERAPKEFLRAQFREARAAWALHLSTVWGLRTNEAGVDALEKQTVEAIREVKERLAAEGLVRADGSRDTKKAADHMRLVCARDGLKLRLTKGGKKEIKGVCLDADACLASDDSILKDYAEFSTLQKTLSADVPMLRAGTRYPVHCKYGLAETSRTTCSGPNLQNLRTLPGIRECFTPRPGTVFIQADFPSLELFTLAQCCYVWLGHSALGDMLKSGIDPHTAFASVLFGCTYEQGVKLKKSGDKSFYKYRQIAKAFNFGKPGGLGNKKLVTLAASKAYRVTITESEARRYSKTWHQTFPEMEEYFALINARMGADNLAVIEIPGTGFVRGGAMYCAACNTGFQGLGAQCAKNAMWRVAQEQYTDIDSPLFGSRTVAMVHDEIICEVDENNVHDAAFRLGKVMVDAANELLPDCPIPLKKMEPTAMKYWSKNAFQLFDQSGRLQAWNGEVAA